MPHTANKNKRKWRYPSSSDSESESRDMDNFIKKFKTAIKDEEVQQIFCSFLEKPFLTRLVEENTILKERIDMLESRIEDMEQYSRRTCLNISGVQEQDNEDTDKIILQLAKEMDVPLQPSEISRSHRLPNSRSKKPRGIIVRFTTYNKRLLFLKGRKKLRETRNKIFVNEQLTKQRADLAYGCRQLKRSRVIKDTWTHDGKIFIKTERNGQEYVHGLTSKRELDALSEKLKLLPQIRAGTNVLKTPRLNLAKQQMSDINEEVMQ